MLNDSTNAAQLPAKNQGLPFHRTRPELRQLDTNMKVVLNTSFSLDDIL
jgi:hypothetical protein